MTRSGFAWCLFLVACSASPSTPDAGFDGGASLDGGSSNAADPNVWLSRTLYLTLPDRFFDGDASNNDAGSANCFDPTSATLFHGGDLAGVRQKIGYLQELGATALWLTPLYRQIPRGGNSCGYHGYWADMVEPDDGAMEPKLGTFDEARAMRDDLHDAGIGLIIDLVVNHTGYRSQLSTQHPDWFHAQATCSALGDAKVYCPLSGLPDFAQEKPEVASYLSAQSRAWVEQLEPDGIRMDTVQHVPMSYFGSSWTPAVRSAQQNLFCVGEVYDEGDYPRFLPALDAGFDSVFDFRLRRALIDSVGKGGSLDLVADRVNESLKTFGPPRALMKTNFLDNHDTARFISDATSGLSNAELWARYRMALVALFTLPGIPQVYAGDELGAFATGDPANRRDMPDWAWDAGARAGTHTGYMANSDEVFALVKTLTGLRANTPALHRGYFSELWRPNGGANLYAYYRAFGTSRAMVIFNGGTTPITVTLPFATNPGITKTDRDAWPEGTVLTDALGAGAPATLTVAGGIINVTVSPKTTGIFRGP